MKPKRLIRNPMTGPLKEQETANVRLVGIDVLRGLAVLAVVCVHMPNDAPGGWRENPWFFASYVMRLGYLGVPLFILLSGYCIHRKAVSRHQTTGAYRINWLAFWKRRFWRLYPTYLVAMAVGLLLPSALGVDPSNQWLGTFDKNHFGTDLLTHLTMTHNLTVEYNTGMRNGVYWSLGLEEQLYALYPVMLLILLKSNWRSCLAGVGAATVLWRFSVPYLPVLPLADGLTIGSFHAWPLTFWWHWILGALAVSAVEGQVLIKRWILSTPARWGFLALGLVLNRNFLRLIENIRPNISFTTETLKAIDTIGSYCFGAFLFSILVWVASHERHWFMDTRVASMLAQIGRMSYSIYLVHVPAILVVHQVDTFEPSGMNWLFRTMTYMTASIIFGAVFYLLVERWFVSGVKPTLRTAVSSRTVSQA